MGDVTTLKIRQTKGVETFLTRLKTKVLNYEPIEDTTGEHIRNHIQNSGIDISHLARSLNITVSHMEDIAKGSGALPNSELRSTMKYIISNYIALQIIEKEKTPR